MKLKKMAALLAAAAVFIALLTLSGCSKAQASQKECPVMGGKIDKASFVDFQGQRVYFCCNDCKEPFLKDAETYFMNLERKGVMPENIQTACPHCGHALESKDHFVDYKGRRIYFCGGNCKTEFGKDPAAVLGKLPGEKAIDNKAGGDGHAHEGHDHHGHKH